MIFFLKQPLTQKHLFGLFGILGITWTLFSLTYATNWSLIGFFILLGIFFVASPLMKPQYKNFYFKNRPKLSEDEIFSTYYSDSNLDRETVLALWIEIGKIFRVPIGKLRPTDSFGKELGGFYLHDDPELDDLNDKVEAYIKKYSIKVNPEEIHTLDDYIRLFSSKSSSDPV